MLAAVDDRHVADTFQTDEEQLALARRFEYQLHRRPLVSGVFRPEHGEAATPGAGTDGPFLVQCQSRTCLDSFVNFPPAGDFPRSDHPSGH